MQTQNDYLRDWKPLRSKYLQALLDLDSQGVSEESGVCGRCAQQDGVIRCLDCYGGQSQCRECILYSHQRLPFHQLEIWNGECFARTSLFDLGFVLNVGHGGHRCPNRTDSQDDLWEDVKISEEGPTDADDVFNDHVGHDSIVVVVDSAGVFRHRVAWCVCNKDLPMQLFREGLFPATYQMPKSAFTFRALDHHTIQSKYLLDTQII
jgi:hypothetical protein